MSIWRSIGRGVAIVGKTAGKAALGAAIPAAMQGAQIAVRGNPWGMLITAAITAAVQAETAVNLGEPKQGELKAAWVDARIEGALIALWEELIGEADVKNPASLELAKQALRQFSFHVADALGLINDGGK